MDQFIVETSARHVHVTRQDLETLFGAGFELTVKKYLSQPGEFASDQRVTVVGPKGEIAGVMILGPVRAASQVELSMTDGRCVGIAAPVRMSGDIAGTPGCKLIGPAGEVELSQGVITARRHIHMTPADAARFGVTNGQTVCAKILSQGRALIFGDVVIRVSEKFALAMHIDTDESNAACAVPGTRGMLDSRG